MSYEGSYDPNCGSMRTSAEGFEIVCIMSNVCAAELRSIYNIVRYKRLRSLKINIIYAC